MSRLARVVIPGMSHHITQRGIRRLDVFRDEEDRLFYLRLFAQSADEYHLTVRSYTLMSNHVHFVATPVFHESIHRVFHWCHGVYVKYFNEKYSLSGHLWEQRPFSCVLSEDHVRNALRYVENNPVRARMVNAATDYRWSSARAHDFGSADPLLTGEDRLAIPGWAGWLDGEGYDPKIEDFIRECTFSGRPCGDEAFIRDIERRTGRRLFPAKRGPKPKPWKTENLSFDWGEGEPTKKDE
jgi:putative transposase